MNSVLASLETSLNAAVQRVEGEIKATADYFVPLVVGAIEKFFDEFAPIAINIILAEAPKVITGEEKFGNAVQHVYSQAIAAGHQIVVADAQQLVQAAYQKVNGVANEQ